ncbi:hypothetical protein VIBRN418_03456 [Vibrio sp. N418]|nr:hypothetical protein VIBRN418_03456 [Vibrio sp. N418]
MLKSFAARVSLEAEVNSNEITERVKHFFNFFSQKLLPL